MDLPNGFAIAICILNIQINGDTVRWMILCYPYIYINNPFRNLQYLNRSSYIDIEFEPKLWHIIVHANKKGYMLIERRNVYGWSMCPDDSEPQSNISHNISHNDDRLLYNMANAPIIYHGFKVPSVEHLGRLRDKLWQATRTFLRPVFEAKTWQLFANVYFQKTINSPNIGVYLL